MPLSQSKRGTLIVSDLDPDPTTHRTKKRRGAHPGPARAHASNVAQDGLTSDPPPNTDNNTDTCRGGPVLQSKALPVHEQPDCSRSAAQSS